MRDARDLKAQGAPALRFFSKNQVLNDISPNLAKLYLFSTKDSFLRALREVTLEMELFLWKTMGM